MSLIAPLSRVPNYAGVAAALAQASKQQHVRSVAIAGLYSPGSELAQAAALEVCRTYGMSSAFLHFEPGRYYWKRFRPSDQLVLEGVSPRRRPSGGGLADFVGVPGAELESEVELPADAGFSVLQATLQELEENSSMVVLGAPPILTDDAAKFALSLAPRLILEVAARTDRSDLAAAARELHAMNVELLGTVFTGYRNPLPKWLDYLLGYR